MPRARSGVRRLAPRLGARARRRRVRHAAVGVHQRPRPHRSRPAQYTHLLDPDDAHVVDDIIVWWIAPGEFLVMPNASNTAPLVDALGEAAVFHGGGECEIDDVTAAARSSRCRAPSAERLATIAPERAGVARFAVEPLDVRRRTRAGSPAPATPARTASSSTCPQPPPSGAGSSCSTPASRPAGLGARDTLRLEAGLPLHGHELGPGITPLQAGLAWVVRFDKGDFRGRAAARGRARARRRPPAAGLRVDGRQIPREGYPVLA